VAVEHGGALAEEWVVVRALAPEIARERYQNAIGDRADESPRRGPLAALSPIGWWEDLQAQENKRSKSGYFFCKKWTSSWFHCNSFDLYEGC
jgi:hypothetical protein